MARESIITIYRSIDPTIPTGLTFGEFGFAGANRQLFIGGTGGGATVQSIWIGASITGDDISTSDGWAGGTGAYRVSTTDAVKRYVDAIAGTKGEVASINGDTGIITITGAGNSAAVSVRSTVAGTHLIDARIATNTGVTGVASFSSEFFNVGATGVVTLKNGNDAFYVQGNSGTKSTVTLGATLGLSGTGSIRTISTSNGFDGVNVVFDNRIASASLTGVASFDPRHFAIGLSGHVSLTGSIGADSVRIASATITGAASFDPRHFALGASGHVSLTGSYQVTGHTVVSAGVASSQVVSTSNNTTTIDNRMASLTVTGVASFDTRHFALGASGHVSLTGSYQVTGNTVVSAGAASSQVVSVVGNIATIDNRMASLTVTGVASFDTRHFALGASGHVSLTGSYQVTGNTVVSAGAASSQVVSVVGNIATIDNRMASLTVTGVASFDTRHFALGASGHVSLTGSYQATGHTVVSVGSSQVATTVGNTTRIDNKLATINGETGVASFGSNFKISNVGKVDLADDVTIVGNLTVQGEVVTANVENFTVQDTLIKLGTGNNLTTSIYDLGFYMQYPAATNNIRLAGFFLDYEDTKFKLFTGLTTGAQDGSTGTDQAARLNTDRQGYTVATLIARLDGGTF